MAKPTQTPANKPAPASPGGDESSGSLVSSGTSMSKEELEDIKVQIAQDLRPDLYYLEESTTAADFYDRLSNIIIRSEYLTADQRDDLAEIVKNPWTGRKNKKGRASLERRHTAIYIRYVLEGGENNKKIRHSIAIKEIKGEYKLSSEDTAAKALSAAKKYWDGKKPDLQGKK
jgi:hypothetical protein